MSAERRRSDTEWRKDLCGRVSHIEDEIVTLTQGLRTNTTLTQQIADDTSWLREVLKEGAGAIRFLCRLAKWWRFTVRYIVLPLAGLIVIPYLIWYWFAHDYTLPLWVQGLLELWK